ncbi:unnamed protein product [Ceratitis capitata]|uniref:(Mediterranean fruit fly) hypothetical protein n=1 Tax=Ceratitis capitata TaxID=7213 RepID=A0A811UF08_CERCA|nr:unnamed protein product [Ceratitis capitata]
MRSQTGFVSSPQSIDNITTTSLADEALVHLLAISFVVASWLIGIGCNTCCGCGYGCPNAVRPP